jgi:hypothetical protein
MSTRSSIAVHSDEFGSIWLTTMCSFYRFKIRFIAKATKEGFGNVFLNPDINPEEVTVIMLREASNAAEAEGRTVVELKHFKEVKKDYSLWIDKCRRAKIFPLECLTDTIKATLKNRVPENNTIGETGIRSIWKYICTHFGQYNVALLERNERDINSIQPCNTVAEFHIGLAQYKDLLEEQDSWKDGEEKVSWSVARQLNWLYRWVQVPALKRTVDMLSDDPDTTMATAFEALDKAVRKEELKQMHSSDHEPLVQASVSAVGSTLIPKGIPTVDRQRQNLSTPPAGGCRRCGKRGVVRCAISPILK